MGEDREQLYRMNAFRSREVKSSKRIFSIPCTLLPPSLTFLTTHAATVRS